MVNLDNIAPFIQGEHTVFYVRVIHRVFLYPSLLNKKSAQVKDFFVIKKTIKKYFIFQGHDPDDARAVRSVLVVSARLTPDLKPNNIQLTLISLPTNCC